MNNKDNLSKLLLKNDPETISLLKEMIVEKYSELEKLTKVYALLKKYELSTLETFDQESLWKCLQAKETRDILSRIERDLHNMVSTLWENSIVKAPHSTDWDKAYRKATSSSEIAATVTHFLGEQNFKRNILCPFHKEKTPSLKVYIGSNRFVCFSCGERGSSIDFVMLYKKCSFREAVLLLSNL